MESTIEVISFVPTVTTHQSSFLPWLGFWHKVLLSDVFVWNSASDFSTTSMYHRTYLPKKQIGEMEYLTLGVDRRGEGEAIEWVLLKPGAQEKLRAQLKNVFNLYKSCKGPDFRKTVDTLNDSLADNFDTLDELNYSMFLAIVDLFHSAGVRVPLTVKNSSYPGTSEDKTVRLIEQLDRFTTSYDRTCYVSGSSGAKYVDMEEFRRSKHGICFQKVTDDDFYHGSILHFLLTMPIADILGYSMKKFDLVPYERMIA